MDESFFNYFLRFNFSANSSQSFKFLLFRYLINFLLLAIICKRPLVECKSFRLVFRCSARLSILAESMVICSAIPPGLFGSNPAFDRASFFNSLCFDITGILSIYWKMSKVNSLPSSFKNQSFLRLVFCVIIKTGIFFGGF